MSLRILPLVALVVSLAAFPASAFEVSVVHGQQTLSGVVTYAEPSANVFFIATDGGDFWRCSMSSGGASIVVGDVVNVSGDVLPQTVNNRIDYCEAKVALPKWRVDLSMENRRDSRKASPVSSVLPAKNSSVNSAPLREIKIIEAKDYSKSVALDGFRWEFLPGLGYGEGAMEVFPRLGSPAGAKLGRFRVRRTRAFAT